MDTEYVKCDECGRQTPVIGMGGPLYPESIQGKAEVFVVIECQECGRRSQPREVPVASSYPRWPL